MFALVFVTGTYLLPVRVFSTGVSAGSVDANALPCSQVERYTGQDPVQLEFLGVRLQRPSWRGTLLAVWPPVLQFALLSALILPMKQMDRRGGRNAWKFQLLALGQAVT